MVRDVDGRSRLRDSLTRKVMSNPKRAMKSLLGRDFFLRIDTTFDHVRFGSEYGGWNVVVSELSPRSVVYSFGVGLDISFDLALIDRYGLTVHAFDPTPKSVDWIRQQKLPPEFLMYPCALASSDGSLTLYPPENPDHVSHSVVPRGSSSNNGLTVPAKRLSTIMRELGHDTIDVLKMDIEGSEYDVIRDFLSAKIYPRQILVEFHHRFTGFGVAATQEAVAALEKNGYRLFWVAASVEEFCFIRQVGGI